MRGIYDNPERGEQVRKALREFREAKQEKVGKIEQISQELGELESRYGPEAVQILWDLVQARRKNSVEDQKELISKAEQLPDYELAGKRALKFFQDTGVIEELPSQRIIIDVTKLRHIEAKSETSKTMGARYLKTYSRQEIVYAALRDKKGLTREEYERGEYDQERDILYIPEDEASAFDPEEIKKAKFILPLWEVTKALSRAQKALQYPTRSGPRVNSESVRLATVIYHPGYGDGYRDENGKLFIRDANSREFKPFTLEGGLNRYVPKPTRGKTDFTEHLRKNAPEILEHGLLRETDFRIISTGKSESSRTLHKEVSTRGIVTLKSVMHYVGREFKPGEAEVVQLSPGEGGILKKDGEERKLTHNFKILKREELPQDIAKREYPYAGWELTQTKEFQIEDYFPKRSNESDEDYQERTAPLEKYETVIKFAQDLQRETGINLDDFSLQEKIYLTAVSEKYPDRREEIFKNAKRFGVEFLHTFSAVEYGMKYGQDILDIAKETPEVIADQIFSKYQEIREAASETQSSLKEIVHERINDRTIKNIADELLRRGNILFSYYAEKARKSIDDKQKLELSRAILRRLDNIKTEILIFASTFKTLSLEKQIEFEDIKNTTLGIKSRDEVMPEEKSEMLRIFQENREEYPPELFKETVGEFKQALQENAKGRKFYILRHRGEIVSFMRLEELPNGNRYAGSLNVRPEARGSAIGSAMLVTILDQESQTHHIEAVAYEKNPMMRHYLGRFGFRKVGEIPDYKGTGQKFFKLERKKGMALAPPQQKAA